MNCEKCGGILPIDNINSVKCEYCDTPNKVLEDTMENIGMEEVIEDMDLQPEEEFDNEMVEPNYEEKVSNFASMPGFTEDGVRAFLGGCGNGFENVEEGVEEEIVEEEHPKQITIVISA